MLSTGSVAEAAEMCGISKMTIYKRLRNPDFKKKYDDSCMDTVMEVKTAIQAKMLGAVAVMSELMDDQTNKAQVRLNAADAVLRHGLKLTEQVDIMEQIAELKGEK